MLIAGDEQPAVGEDGLRIRPDRLGRALGPELYCELRYEDLVLGSEEIAWRMGCVVGIVVYMFAGVAASGMPELIRDSPEENLNRLLAVTVPLMTAPLAEVTA